jgi:hypothetical protein
MANINGWGRGTWDEGAWGEALPVTLTGLAATSALGTLTFDAEANVTVASQLGTTALGSISLVTNNAISVSGLSATSALGSLYSRCRSQCNTSRTSRNICFRHSHHYF